MSTNLIDPVKPTVWRIPRLHARRVVANHRTRPYSYWVYSPPALEYLVDTEATTVDGSVLDFIGVAQTALVDCLRKSVT